MRARFAALGRQTAVYGLAGVSVQAVGLLTLPVFARAFSPAEYGLLEIINVALAALMVIADLGMASAMQRNYYDYAEEDRRGRLTVTSTAIGFAGLLATSFSAMVALLRMPISELLFGTQAHGDLIALLALSIPLALLANMFREVLRLRFRAGHFVVSAAIGAMGTGFGGVFAVTALDSGVSGVLIASAIGLALSMAYSLVAIRHDVGLHFSREELRSLLSYGAPLVPAAAALWALSFLDRIMLLHLGSLSETGEFAVATRFSSVLMFAVVAFATAYSPFLFSLFAEDPGEEKRVRSRLLNYVSVLLVGGALALGLFAEQLAEIVTPGYGDAYKAVGILALGVAAYGVSNVTLSGIALARKTQWIALYTLAALVVNVGLNFVLIPPLGVVGAAVSTAAAYGILAFTYYLRSQRVYHTPYEPGKAAAPFVVAAALLPLAVLHTGHDAVDLALRAGALVIFAAAMPLLRVVGPEEQVVMRRILRRDAP